MSPAGGVGINLAIQDAVATANLLAEKLRTGAVSVDDLRKLQARREWPTRLIQAMQVFIHRRVVTGQTLRGKESLPIVFRLLKWFPVLRQIPARFIGIGPRPEHFAVQVRYECEKLFGVSCLHGHRSQPVGQHFGSRIH